MDAAAHYRYLAQQGRDEFLASVAPAALVRVRATGHAGASALDEGTLTVDHTVEDATEAGDEPGAHDRDDDPTLVPTGEELEVFPLIKKPGASFPDRITIGRTANNDLAFNEVSISRFHAYVRQDGSRWVVADAGSKNGSWLDGLRLEARRERQVYTRGSIRIGDIDLKFYLASELYNVMGGR